MKKEYLPVLINKDQTSWQNHSQWLSVILTNPNNYHWYIKNYFYIYSYLHGIYFFDKYLRIDYLTETAHGRPIKEVFSEFEKVSYLSIKKDFDTIDFIKKQIDDGKYLFIHVDDYCLPNKAFYERKHNVHQYIVYGYNDYSRKVYTIGYNMKNEISVLEYDYTIFHNAFMAGKKNYRKSIKNKEDQAVILLRLKNNNNGDDINFTEILSEFEYYLSSSIPLRFAHIHDRHFKPYSYGINVHNSIVEAMKTAVTRKRGFFVDFRTFQFLFEQKKTISGSLKYINDNYLHSDSAEKSIAMYGRTLETFNWLKNVYMRQVIQESNGKISLSHCIKDKVVINKLIDKIISGTENEEKVIEEFINHLKKLV